MIKERRDREIQAMIDRLQGPPRGPDYNMVLVDEITGMNDEVLPPPTNPVV